PGDDGCRLDHFCFRSNRPESRKWSSFKAERISGFRWTASTRTDFALDGRILRQVGLAEVQEGLQRRIVVVPAPDQIEFDRARRGGLEGAEEHVVEMQ